MKEDCGYCGRHARLAEISYSNTFSLGEDQPARSERAWQPGLLHLQEPYQLLFQAVHLSPRCSFGIFPNWTCYRHFGGGSPEFSVVCHPICHVLLFSRIGSARHRIASRRLESSGDQVRSSRSASWRLRVFTKEDLSTVLGQSIDREIFDRAGVVTADAIVPTIVCSGPTGVQSGCRFTQKMPLWAWAFPLAAWIVLAAALGFKGTSYLSALAARAETRNLER